MSDNWISISEMDKIKEICLAAHAFYKAAGSIQNGNVSVDEEIFSGFKVFDENGDVLGTIGMVDDGTFGLYLP